MSELYKKIFGNVKPETVIRTACLFLSIINFVLEYMGKSVIPISNDQVREFITNGWFIASSIWGWWKNNSFTGNAILADDYKASLDV